MLMEILLVCTATVELPFTELQACKHIYQKLVNRELLGRWYLPMDSHVCRTIGLAHYGYFTTSYDWDGTEHE